MIIITELENLYESFYDTMDYYSEFNLTRKRNSSNLVEIEFKGRENLVGPGSIRALFRSSDNEIKLRIQFYYDIQESIINVTISKQLNFGEYKIQKFSLGMNSEHLLEFSGNGRLLRLLLTTRSSTAFDYKKDNEGFNLEELKTKY